MQKVNLIIYILDDKDKAAAGNIEMQIINQ